LIYFATTPTGSIKIGESEDVDSRLWSLQRHYNGPVELLATIPGGPDEEREIHRQFAHHRFGRSEQFRPASELTEFIGCKVVADPSAVRICGRDDVVVKLDRGVAAQARYVADSRNIPLAEYLTEITRGVVRRDFDRAAKGSEE
jgi:hypothetical protein